MSLREHMREMNAHTRLLHAVRSEHARTSTPDINGNAELAAAWHSLQLHWLSTVPGYREEVRQRVAAAARAAQVRDERLDRHMPRLEIDLLGRDLDGCG